MTEPDVSPVRVTEPDVSTRDGAPAFAWRPVGLVVLGVIAMLAATITSYGYERDELYFRVLGQHPAWGYVDEPPLTPLLTRASIALFGDHVWAPRIPAMLCAAAAVLLAAFLARELGGGGTAQVLTAVVASTTFVLVAGHVMVTASPDLVVWEFVLLFAARALLRNEPRWWLAAGLTVGLGLYNKQLIVLLLLGILAGLLIAGPRSVFRHGALWGGVAIAIVVGSPNLIYQIAHHWPELSMARQLSADKGANARAIFVPFQLILLGLFAAPIWIAGFVALFRRRQWRPIRCLAWAYPVVCVLTLVSGGQPYYTFGLLVLMAAAGSVVTAQWLRGHRPRAVLVAVALAVNVAGSVLFSLPVIPERSLPAFVATANQTDRDSIGWPRYVDEVAAVYDSLPASDQANAIIFTGNYGEAGAVARFGPAHGLPAVYSGQNELFNYGPPPDTATVVVEVNESEDLAPYFDSCVRAGTLDDRVGVDNEEQGAAITVCRGRHGSWGSIWPALQHYG